MEKLQLLITVGNEIEGEIIKQKLAEAGIETLMKIADSENMLPSLDYTNGVSIYVEPEDFETASALIGAGPDDLEDDMEIGVGD